MKKQDKKTGSLPIILVIIIAFMLIIPSPAILSELMHEVNTQPPEEIETITEEHSIETDDGITSRSESFYISVSQAKKAINEDRSAIVLDVRSSEEYSSGHISDAISVPFTNLGCDSCLQRKLNQYKEDIIIVYSESIDDSRLAYDILVQNGFSQVYILDGGINAWRDAGFTIIEPVAKEMLYSRIDENLGEGTFVFVFFYTNWCSYSQQQMSIIDELNIEYSGVIDIIYVDAEENPQLAEVFDVTSYPRMFLIKDKDEGDYILQEFKGFTDKNRLYQAFDSALSEDEPTMNNQIIWNDISDSNNEEVIPGIDNQPLAGRTTDITNNEIEGMTLQGNRYQPMRITRSSGGSKYPSIVVDEEDQVHIVWQDDRDTNWQVYYKKLDNSGSTLVDDTRLTNTSFNAFNPQIGIDYFLDSIVSWTDDRHGNNEIYYTRINETGIPIIQDKRVTDTSGISAESSLDIDITNNAHLVWHDDTPGNYDIYYKKIDECVGVFFENDQLTTDPSGSYYPFVKTDERGRTHVVWYDDRHGDTEIYYKFGVSELFTNDENISLSSYTPADNSEITIYAYIYNNGTFQSNVTVGFFNNEILIGTETIDYIYPGDSELVTMNWNASPEGYNEITVAVDPFNTINEFDETNNNATIGLTVSTDTDGDGLSDDEELIAGTDIGDWDSDDDNVSDGDEVHGFFNYDRIESEDYYSFWFESDWHGSPLSGVLNYQTGAALGTERPDYSRNMYNNVTYAEIVLEMDISQNDRYKILTWGDGKIGLYNDSKAPEAINIDKFTGEAILNSLNVTITPKGLPGSPITPLYEEMGWNYAAAGIEETTSHGDYKTPLGIFMDYWYYIGEFDLSPNLYDVILSVTLEPDPNDYSCEFREFIDDLRMIQVINDYFLIQKKGIDPLNNDTDSDTVLDGDEIFYGSFPLSVSGSSDPDEDGISDFYELFVFNTSPYLRDTDFDGLIDNVELGHNKTNWFDPYTFWDSMEPNRGLNDISNFDADPTTTTDPLNRDTDGDSLPDGWIDGWFYHSKLGWGPYNNQEGWHHESVSDPPFPWYYSEYYRNKSYLNQRWEGEDLNYNGLTEAVGVWDISPSSNDTNVSWWIYSEGLEEEIDPNNPDSDLDNMPDAWEIRYGLDPINTYFDDSFLDYDVENGSCNILDEITSRFDIVLGYSSYLLEPSCGHYYENPYEPGYFEWNETQCWFPGNATDDGLINLDEYIAGTNPRFNDTDFDNLTDGDEVSQVIFRTNVTNGSKNFDNYGNTQGYEWIWFNGVEYGYLITKINQSLFSKITIPVSWVERKRMDIENVMIARLEDDTFIVRNRTSDEILVCNEVGHNWTCHVYSTLASEGEAETSSVPVVAYKDQEIYLTNPLDANTDDDQMIDSKEFDWNVDFDNDGLVNARDVDSDSDGLPDYYWFWDNDLDNDSLIGLVDPDSDADRLLDGQSIILPIGSEIYNYFVNSVDNSISFVPVGGGKVEFIGEHRFSDDDENITYYYRPDTDGDRLLDGYDIDVYPGEYRYSYFMNLYSAWNSTGIWYEDHTGYVTFKGDLGQGTSPTEKDTDNDLLWDGPNVSYTQLIRKPGRNITVQRFYYGDLGVTTNPLDPDHDGDEILDGIEVYGWDIDIIGLNNVKTRKRVSSNPKDPHSDTDGIIDTLEYLHYDASNSDTDGDNITDNLEDENLNYTVDPGETDPLDVDTDDDLIPDGWIDFNLNGSEDPGEGEDIDYDGWDEGVETNPTDPDTDDDGLDDGLEENIVLYRANFDQLDNLTAMYMGAGSLYGSWIAIRLPLSNYRRLVLFAYRNSTERSSDPLYDYKFNFTTLQGYEILYNENLGQWWPGVGMTYGKIYVKVPGPGANNTYYEFMKFRRQNERHIPERTVRTPIYNPAIFKMFYMSGFGWVRETIIDEMRMSISDSLVNDTDYDGILDGEELSDLGDWDRDGDGLINIADNDSDGDYIIDSNDLWFDQNPSTAYENETPCPGADYWVQYWHNDFDGDGYPNALDNDSDGDGVYDGDEDTNRDGYWNQSALETNPLGGDSDDDGLTDGAELMWGTDPNNPDTDDDTWLDGEELSEKKWGLYSHIFMIYGTWYADSKTWRNPLPQAYHVDTSTSTDIDNDGINNALDIDSDGDGLLDGHSKTIEGTFYLGEKDIDALNYYFITWEYVWEQDAFGNWGYQTHLIPQNGTNPWNPDSDYDGINDSTELDFDVDTDGDGHINALDVDSDDDGLLDGMNGLEEICEIIEYEDVYVWESEENPSVLKDISYIDCEAVFEGIYWGETFTFEIRRLPSEYGYPTEDRNGNGKWDPGEPSPILKDSDDDVDGNLNKYDFMEYLDGTLEGINPFNPDLDLDGMPDAREIEFGLNPYSRDTDGDNVIDGVDLQPNAYYDSLNWKDDYPPEGWHSFSQKWHIINGKFIDDYARSGDTSWENDRYAEVSPEGWDDFEIGGNLLDGLYRIDPTTDQIYYEKYNKYLVTSSDYLGWNVKGHYQADLRGEARWHWIFYGGAFDLDFTNCNTEDCWIEDDPVGFELLKVYLEPDADQTFSIQFNMNRLINLTKLRQGSWEEVLYPDPDSLPYPDDLFFYYSLYEEGMNEPYYGGVARASLISVSDRYYRSPEPTYDGYCDTIKETYEPRTYQVNMYIPASVAPDDDSEHRYLKFTPIWMHRNEITGEVDNAEPAWRQQSLKPEGLSPDRRWVTLNEVWYWVQDPLKNVGGQCIPDPRGGRGFFAAEKGGIFKIASMTYSIAENLSLILSKPSLDQSDLLTVFRSTPDPENGLAGYSVFYYDADEYPFQYSDLQNIADNTITIYDVIIIVAESVETIYNTTSSLEWSDAWTNDPYAPSKSYTGNEILVSDSSLIGFKAIEGHGRTYGEPSDYYAPKIGRMEVTGPSYAQSINFVEQGDMVLNVNYDIMKYGSKSPHGSLDDSLYELNIITNNQEDIDLSIPQTVPGEGWTLLINEFTTDKITSRSINEIDGIPYIESGSTIETPFKNLETISKYISVVDDGFVTYTSYTEEDRIKSAVITPGEIFGLTSFLIKDADDIFDEHVFIPIMQDLAEFPGKLTSVYDRVIGLYNTYKALHCEGCTEKERTQYIENAANFFINEGIGFATPPVVSTGLLLADITTKGLTWGIGEAWDAWPSYLKGVGFAKMSAQVVSWWADAFVIFLEDLFGVSLKELTAFVTDETVEEVCEATARAFEDLNNKINSLVEQGENVVYVGDEPIGFKEACQGEE